MESRSTEPNTVEHWHEMECRLEYMQTQVEEAKAALARQHIQQQELVERAEKAENAVAEMEHKNTIAQEEIKILHRHVEKEKKEKQLISDLLQEAKESLRKTNAILEATQRTEVCLTDEANSILISLEKSIRDGDKLHQLLAEARDSDIQKRNATKKFHDASVAMILKVINQMNEINKYSNDFEQSVGGHLESETKLRDKTFANFVKKLNDTKSKITTLANAIESLAMDENGMKQSLVDASILATEKIELSKTLMMESEEKLRESIQKILGDVSKSSDDLKGKHIDYMKFSDEFLSQFENNITTVKEKLCAMVTNATGCLSTVRDSSAQTRNNLISLLGQIASSSDENSSSSKKIMSEHMEQIDSTNNMFSNNIKYHKHMVDSLKKQSTLMQSCGSEQINEIHLLNQIIKDQKISFDQAYKEQNRIHSEVLSNMYDGMKSLLDTEMKRISENTEKMHNTFTLSNGSMLAKNESIGSSASHIFDNVKNTSDDLLETVKSTQVNTNSIKAVVKQSKSTLGKIEHLVSEGQKINGIHVEQALAKVEELATLDGDVIGIENKLVSENKAIERYTSDTIVSEAHARIAQLSQTAQNNVDFTVNTILSNISDDVNCMKAPREKLSNKLTSNLHQIATSLDEATSKILPQFEDQGKKADKIRTTISSYGTAFEKMSATYCDNVQTNSMALTSTSSEFKSNTSNLITKCQGSLSDTNKTVTKFSKTDIRAEEVVPPLLKKQTIEYCSNFTSTPSADVILQDFKIADNEDANNDTISVKSEASCLSSTQGSITQDITLSSNESLQTINDHKPSPLMELSMNCGNSGDNSSDELMKKPLRHGKKRPTQRNDPRQQNGVSKRRKERAL